MISLIWAYQAYLFSKSPIEDTILVKTLVDFSQSASYQRPLILVVLVRSQPNKPLLTTTVHGS